MMLKKFVHMFAISCVMLSMISISQVSIIASAADKTDTTEASGIVQEETKEEEKLCNYLKTKADIDGDGYEENLLLFTRDFGDNSKLEMGYLAVLDDEDDIKSEVFIGCVNMPCDMQLYTTRKEGKTYIGFSSNYGIEGGCRGYMILSYEDRKLKKEIGIENPGYTSSYGLYLVTDLKEEDNYYSDGEQLYDGSQYSEYIDALKEQLKPYGFAIEVDNEEVQFYADERMVPENPKV